MKKARYNRISSHNQKLERQLARNHKDEIIFNDVVSGSISFKERDKGKELMKAVEAGSINFVSVSAVYPSDEVHIVSSFRDTYMQGLL